MSTDYIGRRRLEAMDRRTLHDYQLARLNEVLESVLRHNPFYSAKLSEVRLPVRSLDEMQSWLTTSKEELVGGLQGAAAREFVGPSGVAELGPEAGLAKNLTFALERYVRYHRTSGTRGAPLVVLDTAEDWQWWIDGWQFVLDAASITATDRVLMAFSFGPFIGFWSAFDAVTQRGALAIPTGGLSTLARLETLRASRATAMLCTPSYALHMAEVAVERGLRLSDSDVRVIIVAGEPGGSIPSLRSRIEQAWGARLVDHAGATEVGPWGFPSVDGAGLHVNESQFIAELLVPGEETAALPGETAELVLTTLGRVGCPVIRYRTGDLVRGRHDTGYANRFLFLEGGVLGRTDDMLIVRGVNIFPSSIAQILHELPQVVDFRITARKRGALDELSIEVEDRRGDPDAIAETLNVRLGLKVAVESVPIGSLPRSEGKGKRFRDERAPRDVARSWTR